MRKQTFIQSLLDATAMAILAFQASANDWPIDPSPYRAANSTNANSAATTTFPCR